MQKIFLSLAVLLASVGWANAANGFSESSVVASTTSVPSNFIGSYYGLLYDIEMMGNTGYDDQNMTFTVTTGNVLHGVLPQIGSMPGTITIDLPISVATDGTMATTADASTKVGTLVIPSFGITISLTLDGSASTAFSNATIDPVTNEMNFTLKVKGSYFGTNFPASVSFTSSVFTP